MSFTAIYTRRRLFKINGPTDTNRSLIYQMTARRTTCALDFWRLVQKHKGAQRPVSSHSCPLGESRACNPYEKCKRTQGEIGRKCMFQVISMHCIFTEM